MIYLISYKAPIKCLQGCLMKLTTKFGKRLKEIRKGKNLSQQQLAELVGMESSNNISKLESGEQLPKKENLEKLCCALNIEAKELFDFGHFESREDIIKDLNNKITLFSLKDLQYFKRVIDAYLETR